MRRQQTRSRVSVLTGFLGSGKTTLLRGLLANPRLQNTAVILNEFGEVGLDHLLVETGKEEVVLLDSGCLCCTINDSLSETLADLMFRKARGDIPAFNRVIIETSGLADPAPILHCLLSDKLLARHYQLDGVICVVDGLHGLAQLQTAPEAIKQVALADRLVISKTDLADDPVVGRLRSHLSSINSGAEVLQIVSGELDDPTSIIDIEPTERLLAEPTSDHQHHRELGHDGASAHAGISTFSLTLSAPATWAGYDFWVRRLKLFRAPDLLRLKGVIGIEGRSAPYFVQGVQHVFSPPEPLAAWPWLDHQGRLVFITRGLDAATLTGSLDSLRQTAGVQRTVTGQDAL